jgi:hypothetical protein
VDPFLAWIEGSDLSNWIRGSESLFAFPAIITLHTIGMGFLAGGGAAIALRLLGFAPGIPLKPLARFYPLLWIAFVVNVTTGVLLLIAYPTKALTNPLFYLKLVLVGVAVWLLARIGSRVLRDDTADGQTATRYAGALALASLAVWVGLITVGRLLAYTNRWELLGIAAIH